MCIIYVKPDGVEIPEEYLREGWRTNNDGGGFMFAHKGNLCVRKGYSKLKPFLKRYRKDMKKFDNPLACVHFRIATSGEVDYRNCHPHKVGKNIAIMHNGMFSEFSFRNSEKSDTLLFAERLRDTMPAEFEQQQHIINLLELYIKSEGSRVALMTNNGQVIIFNRSTWIEDGENGILYSNSAYKPYSTSRYSFYDDDDYGYGSAPPCATEDVLNLLGPKGAWLRECSACATKFSPYRLSDDTIATKCKSCEYIDSKRTPKEAIEIYKGPWKDKIMWKCCRCCGEEFSPNTSSDLYCPACTTDITRWETEYAEEEKQETFEWELLCLNCRKTFKTKDNQQPYCDECIPMKGRSRVTCGKCNSTYFAGTKHLCDSEPRARCEDCGKMMNQLAEKDVRVWCGDCAVRKIDRDTKDHEEKKRQHKSWKGRKRARKFWSVCRDCLCKIWSYDCTPTHCKLCIEKRKQELD
jgi:predicted glutamine amidotransferase